MYREHNKGLPFPFEHCWNMLKHQPKWSAECEKKKLKRVRSPVQSTPSTPSTTSTPDTSNNIEADMTCDIVDPMERPIGRKAEKEKRRKLNSNASLSVVDLLVAMQEERKNTSSQNLEILKSSVAIQGEFARIEAEKEEERIMTLDTSTMTSMLQEYYHHRQLEILDRRRNKQSSSSSSSRIDSDGSEFEL